MGRLLVPFLVLCAALAGVVLSDRPVPRADLTISNGNDVTTLDLQRMSWMNDLRVARLLFEGLVANDVFDPEYRIIPAVAERWEISPDGREYRFFLRPGAEWSNGEPVRASDFVFAWRRAILPDTAADYYTFFEYIEGVAEFFRWRSAALQRFADETRGLARAERARAAEGLWDQTEAKFAELVRVRAVSDSELVLRLERPIPFFLDLLAFATFYPVYPPLVRQYDRLDPDTGRVIAEGGWTKPPHIVSNGPYELTVWRFKRDMFLEANEHYWNRAALSVRTIAIPSIADPNAQVLAFQTGQVQFCAEISAPYRREMIAQKDAFYRDHRDEYERLLAEGWDSFQIDRLLPDDPRAHVHASPVFGTYFW
ncbi:MAG TPA: ABC transporter substrate-binding protein, partial [Phycisphaerales bacterium]|nr:ABC transporter substrate-binding protein [Phycisphaerales bacterium]